MKIIRARTENELKEVRQLFLEYQQFLGVDLCFQGFKEELAGLPGKYAPPKGALLLAVEEPEIAGCVALRELDEAVCEMKRLFVRPPFRGRGVGRLLAQAIIEEARKLDYLLMRLDTLDSLKAALGLYESLGFKKTEPYYDNPLPGVVYWEMRLKK